MYVQINLAPYGIVPSWPLPKRKEGKGKKRRKGKKREKVMGKVESVHL